MNTKLITRCACVVIAAHACQASASEDDGSAVFGLIYIVVTAVIVYLCVKLFKNRSHKKEKELQELAARQESEQQTRQREEADFFAVNGQPDKSYTWLNEGKVSDAIHIYNSDKVVWILGKKYNYSDIVECELIDETFGKSTDGAVTKTSSNALGRAVVGGLVGGVAGAAIGAVTATKTSEVVSPDVRHYYYLHIRVSDPVHPLIRIATHVGKEDAEEMQATFAAIIASNNK